MSYQPIENYGVIGNLQTVALVSTHGSIDFLSFPYFDSPTVFAAILDDKKGGHFSVAPVGDGFRQKQMYLYDTNVLRTRFYCESGVAEVSDFMPLSVCPTDVGDGRDNPTRVVRRVKVVRGEMRCRLVCAPRFDYARGEHKLDRRSDKEILFVQQGGDKLVLRLRSLNVPLHHRAGDAHAEFTLRAGEKATFVLEEVREGEDSSRDSHDQVIDAFKETINYWQGWVARSTYKGRWREIVNRSALTLKMMTSQKYGSIVAAPTFGLPEAVGHGRNWDYRYTWVRDASFTIYGLNRLGYNDEAGAFMRWIEDRCRDMHPDKGLQLMYGIDGRAELPEIELPHLDGYRGSQPVRIGNAASDQLQLDIYGELMDSVYLYDKYGKNVDYEGWQDITKLINYVCKNYRRKDAGIWEVRGGNQEFLYSKLMCWVAVDRAIRLAGKRSFPTPPALWYRTRDTLYKQIQTKFWNPKLGAFIQAVGKPAVDASSLLMPMVRFVSPTDRRWLSSMRVIERDLVEDSLVYRYKDDDGLGGAEGTFTMCSFWYVECLARSGDLPKAQLLFEKMLGYANHLGLYAEELGPSGEHLGNFPQAFTHLALISAAYNLDRLLDNPHALV